MVSKIELLLNDEYMKEVAAKEADLDGEDIAILYKMGWHEELFSNQKIKLPPEVVFAYVKEHKVDKKEIFLRPDVQGVLEEALNIYIENYVYVWMNEFQKNSTQVPYLLELACANLIFDVKVMIDMGINFTEGNLKKIVEHKSGMLFWQDATDALQKVLELLNFQEVS